MPDTLTASYCERCGTRHEFRTPTGLNPLRKTRGFIGGLKQYLVSDEALSDSMRDSMQAQASVIAATQLDAFHQTFHLCLDCRQYTCNDCWNPDGGRCRSCMPLPAVDDLADRIAASLDTAPAAVADSTIAVFEHATPVALPADSWPEEDHEVYPSAAVADGVAEASADLPVQAMEEQPADMPLVAELPEPIVAQAQHIPDAHDADAIREPDTPFAAADADPPEWPQEPFAAEAYSEPYMAAAETDAEPYAAEAETYAEPYAAEAETDAEPYAAEAEVAPYEAEAEAEADVPEEPPVPAPPTLRIVAWDEDTTYSEAPAEQAVDAYDELVTATPPERDEALAAAEAPEEPFAAIDTEPEQDEALAAAEAPEEPFVAIDTEPEPWVAEADMADEQPSMPSAAEIEPEPVAPHAEAMADEPEPIAAQSEPEPLAAEAPSELIEPQPRAAEWPPKPSQAETSTAAGDSPAGWPPQAAAPLPASGRRSGPMRDRIVRLPDQREVTAPQVRVAAEADTGDVAARRAQLEELGLAQSPEAQAADAAQVVPYRPREAASTAPEAAAATAIREGALLWEASAREVDSPGVTVQSCDDCGLALSASARFCRRCGARQAQSA